jgi:threonine dehydrogenase-like Zn-dependent dehydrogenase
MKAAVYTGLTDRGSACRSVISDPYEVIIKVHTCSVCGVDLRIFHHGNLRAAA